MIRSAALVLVAALLAIPALADDDADLRATSYFKSCDAADFAEDQCLCFAKALSRGGQNVDPVLLNALEEDFTLQNKGQATIPAVHAALGRHNPPISASDDKINEALIALVKATHKCASSG